jgi:anti-sigma B factor antagonist
MHRRGSAQIDGLAIEDEMADANPTYELRERPAGRTLVVRGELDLATTDDLRQELHAVIAESHSPAYVDLSGVTFFDSSSIAVLIDARRLAPSHDSELIIVSPSRACRRVLDVLGLEDVLDVRDELPAT